jgi:signal peptidase I
MGSHDSAASIWNHDFGPAVCYSHRVDARYSTRRRSPAGRQIELCTSRID